MPLRLTQAGATVAGVPVDVATAGRQGEATAAVRPEHLRLVEPGAEGALPATVTRSVYFGTDSHLHLALADGTELVLRQQSGTDDTAALPAGTKVAVAIAPGALQVLED